MKQFYSNTMCYLLLWCAKQCGFFHIYVYAPGGDEATVRGLVLCTDEETLDRLAAI
jgi:hypothetical protein